MNREAFATPANPSTADRATLQNQLNTYLAMEAGVRVRALPPPVPRFDWSDSAV